MSQKIEFWFHFGANGTKSGLFLENDVVHIVTDEIRRMTYDRILKQYCELGYRNSKNIYLCESGTRFETGSFFVTDEKSCKSVMEYFELISCDKIEIFADDGDMHVFTVENDQATNSIEDLTNANNSNYISPLGYVSEEDEDDDSEYSSETGYTTIVDENSYSEHTQGHFAVGMTFASVQEARDAINEYAVNFGYKLKFEKSDPTRLKVLCLNQSDCPFKLFVSKDGTQGGMVVKTVVTEHNCFRQLSVPSASQMFLAKYFKSQIYRNPKFSIKDMQAEVLKHLKLDVSLDKCKRAKRIVMQELEGSYKQEFANLAAYANILKESNPGTKAEIQLCEEGLKHGRRIFRRMFIMLDACKRNWLGGCRPILSLDGCFLKGVCQGQLLTAVGKDGNDQVVLIAWAVVNKENKVNWRWFLCWLRQELELGDGLNITVMSDMQKGLIDAVNFTIPKAEHRWCARHIHANWSKKWKGDELKKRFWICAWSTFEEDFVINLRKLGEVHKKAAEDLLKYPVQTWCRAYQSSKCHTFMVDNNISESFNSSILNARYKPIMTMLEEMRVYAMNKIKDRKKLCEAWVSGWSPVAMGMYEFNREMAIGCRVIWNGASGYEIGEGENKHTVLLDRMVCTCRVWELTGIPCAHAISAMHYSKIDPLSVMSMWYHKSTYEKAYHNPILPVPGIKFMKADQHEPIEPPPIQKMPGRPRKKRVRASNEPVGSGNKLSKKGKPQQCSICNMSGHKRIRCPNEASQFPGNSTSSTHASSSSRPTKLQPRKPDSSSKKFVGIGCHVNLSTGRITSNPGLSSERIIYGGESMHDSDPVVRGPIPNEREINRHKVHMQSIRFNGEGSEVRIPSSLPFNPPGLQWKGVPSITTRQLLEQRDARKSR